MFWSKKKSEPKAAPREVPSGQEQAVGSAAHQPQELADEPVTPSVAPALEQNSTAVDQLVDLDEISAPTEQPLPSESATQPPPLSTATREQDNSVGASVEQATPSQQETEARRRSLAALAMRYAKFGEVVALLATSPQFKHCTLADMEWLVQPAMLSGQFSVAEFQSRSTGSAGPGGVVLWARVSDEVEAKLISSTEPVARLEPEEWTSGNKLWIMVTAGDRRILHPLLGRLMQTEWSGQTPKLRVRRQDGQMGVVSLNLSDADVSES
ncbi:MAG: toxin-activating lysine-acyltransferase [Pseudomonadota bacterium]